VGGLRCCNDDGACVGADPTGGPEDYAVRYTVTYETDLAALEPVMILTSAIPGEGPTCAKEYDIPRGGGLDVRRRSVVVSGTHSFTAVLGLMHLHSGAVNATLRRGGAAAGGEVVCVSLPQYDAGGFMVGTTPCAAPFEVAAGEAFEFEAVYDNTAGLDPATYPDTAVTGAMSYLYLAGVQHS
jgi:hypothetical protein